jgi:hypothetical protein
MAVSRITKSVVEVLGADSYDQAAEIRRKDVDFILPDSGPDGLQIMVQSAAALVLRCFTGRLRVHGAETVDLRALIQDEARKMNALDRLEFGPKSMGPWMLAFGCKRDGAICGDASGWTARINDTFKERLPAGCAATFAAACMVGKLFNVAILKRDRDAYEAWDFCLSSFTSDKGARVRSQEVLDLGRVGILGAGALGSAVGFVLLRSRAKADVIVMDPQSFDDPNLETCILADVLAVNGPRKKAVHLAEILKLGGIEARAELQRVEAGNDLLKLRWNGFVCGVDNPETRRMLDETNTRVLLNAGLGDSKEDAGFVLWTRHLEGGAPLSELYSPARSGARPAEVKNDGTVPKEFREECTRMAYQGVSLSIPFAALVAGSLLVAGLYHEARGEAPVDNYLQMDLFAKQERYQRRLRG